MRHRTQPPSVLACLLAAPAVVFAQGEASVSVITGRGFEVAFSTTNGSIASARQKGTEGTIFASGEHGLWRIRFKDGSEVRAADYRAGSRERSFRCETEEGGTALRMGFRSQAVVVDIIVKGRPDGVDLIGEITPGKEVVLDFALPARLRFDPDQLDRFVCPGNGNQTVGTAFNARFFRLQPQDRPSGWRTRRIGPDAYARLYGGPLVQREDLDPPVALRITDEGREWLGRALAQRLDGAKALVNRSPTRAPADLVVLDSANGPYFSANRLGGAGAIWRLGGRVDKDDTANALAMVSAVVGKLCATAPEGRRKLGIVALRQGPSAGGWAAVKVTDWIERVRGLGVVARGDATVVELTTVGDMAEALKGDEFLTTLNPYGEHIPALEPSDVSRTVDMIRGYVRAGGNWFEVGGYPFYYALVPVRYYHYAGSYPANFADFLHLDTRAGSASVYGVQPQTWAPWEGAKRKEALFVPGRMACGGDENGGYCEREFGTYVAPGETWRSPTVRLCVGHTAAESLRAYCEANAIERRLDEKMPAALLAKFKRSVLVYYAGTCRDKLKHLPMLPVPSLVHFADYLKGGFDKEYPDHLPPHPNCGTETELRAFFDKCHELGHLVMPYTNPTWWCDEPPGPTFVKHGDAPLLRKLDGSLSHERYVKNVGFTVCHWHAAVQAANRETVRQFSEQYPVDILFQDQCGARGWLHDTNPASPTPYAYSDGLISMVAEDCQAKPLSTEAGWDRVVNYESQLCGLSWAIVPSEHAPVWRRLMKERFAPDTWTVFPLAQYIAHDKAAMLYHDLGQFVTNRETLAWALGLGFCMSSRVGAAELTRDAARHWLLWLDRIQKSVCSRYVGEPLTAFEHDRGKTPSVEDDGMIRATYGDLGLVANLGPVPRTEGDRELPPFGFHVRAPGLVAGNLGSDFGTEGVSFASEGTGSEVDVWVYAPAEQCVCVELPAAASGQMKVTLDSSPAQTVRATEGTLSFRLPTRPGRRSVQPPPPMANRAPRDWPGAKPAIGIIDVGLKPAWTSISADDWCAAFGQSEKLGVPVRRITSPVQLAAALKAGPREWLAIVNPYGEVFPAVELTRWAEMLDLVKHYVEHGGCWWETAGYSLFIAASPDGRRNIGPRGMVRLGLQVGGGDVAQPAERLHVPAEGRAWLDEKLAARIERMHSVVNRGAPRGRNDPGHVALVAGAHQDFIAGYRLDGWGWLWRIGGFHPNPHVALPAAVAAMEHLYTHLPLPIKPGRAKYLWHAVVTSAN